MSGGWKADGRTAPSWRSCCHAQLIANRCSCCGAMPIAGYVQVAHDRRGGVPIGSMLLEPTITKSPYDLNRLKGDGKAIFNRPLK